MITHDTLIERLRNDRYNEHELSGNGECGDFERGYRRGWNHAMGHVERILGEVSAPLLPAPDKETTR